MVTESPDRIAIMNDRESSADVTRLLREWQAGNPAALDRLIPLVYDELHVIASRHMAREWRQGTVETAALVNEAYVKLVDQHAIDWQNRAHFFAIAARVMRRILIDHARRRLRGKHGGGVALAMSASAIAVPGAPGLDPVDTLAIDRALHQLEALDPDQARIVELRFFAGLTVEETASVIGSSPATVKREWASAKAYLYRALTAKRVDT
jgi:RNA polymerase sigma factor (TIGR02999 family)